MLGKQHQTRKQNLFKFVKTFIKRNSNLVKSKINKSEICVHTFATFQSFSLILIGLFFRLDNPSIIVPLYKAQLVRQSWGQNWHRLRTFPYVTGWKVNDGLRFHQWLNLPVMNSCSRVASTNVAVIITQDDVSTKFCPFEFDQKELFVCLFKLVFGHFGRLAFPDGGLHSFNSHQK